MPNPNKHLQHNKINSSNNNNSHCSSGLSAGFHISSIPSSTNKNQTNTFLKKQSPSALNAFPKDRATTNISSRSYGMILQTEESDLYSKQPFTESDIILNKKLLITEIEGTQLNNKCIIINCASMVNGKRNKKDGLAIFGLTNYNNNNDNDVSNTSQSNDFMFSLKPNQINVDINIHLFIIYFSQNKKKYFIRTYLSNNINKPSNANGNEFTIGSINDIFFVRINDSYQVNKEDIFMIGDLAFVFRVDNDKLIVTKMKHKNFPEEEVKTFVDENGNATFTIGRNSNCSFSFPTNRSLSKIHCSIKYNKIDKTWVVYDGIFGKNKKSTNGIWLLPKKRFEIYNEMEFKILGCSKCQIKIKD
jgi:hypothetical protein